MAIPAKVTVPYRMTLSMILMTCLLAGAFLSVRPVVIAGAILPGGVFLGPFTYSILAVVVEVYGLPTARRMVEVSVACISLTAIVVEGVIHLPAPAGSEKAAAAFSQLYQADAKSLVAGIFGFAVACVVTTQAMLLLARMTHGRLLFMRLCGAPIMASVIASSIAIPIRLNGQMGSNQILTATIDRDLASVFIYVATMPFVWALVQYIRDHEAPRPLPSYRFPDAARHEHRCG